MTTSPSTASRRSVTASLLRPACKRWSPSLMAPWCTSGLLRRTPLLQSISKCSTTAWSPSLSLFASTPTALKTRSRTGSSAGPSVANPRASSCCILASPWYSAAGALPSDSFDSAVTAASSSFVKNNTRPSPSCAERSASSAGAELALTAASRPTAFP